jgi:hypothetical protein
MSIDTCNESPMHTQMPYTTKNGVKTEVDANLAFTLELMKCLGVETYYSCEGDKPKKGEPPSPAYILGNGRDMLRLEMQIKRLAKQGKLSDDSVWVVKNLFGKRHTIAISHFVADESGRERTCFQLQFGDLRYYGVPRAGVTKTWSKEYGFRINWKWPTYKTSEVARMLAEVYQFA